MWETREVGSGDVVSAARQIHVGARDALIKIHILPLGSSGNNPHIVPPRRCAPVTLRQTAGAEILRRTS